MGTRVAGAPGLRDRSRNSDDDDRLLSKKSLAPLGYRQLRGCPHPTQLACPVPTEKGGKDMEGLALSGQPLAMQGTPSPPPLARQPRQRAVGGLGNEWGHRVLSICCVPRSIGPGPPGILGTTLQEAAGPAVISRKAQTLTPDRRAGTWPPVAGW